MAAESVVWVAEATVSAAQTIILASQTDVQATEGFVPDPYVSGIAFYRRARALRSPAASASASASACRCSWPLASNPCLMRVWLLALFLACSKKNDKKTVSEKPEKCGPEKKTNFFCFH